jgi:DNA-directed RNA polymerase subunit N (RpoN/RPB10)
LADKWEYYKKEVEKLQKQANSKSPKMKNFEAVQTKDVLDHLGLHKYCCRRVFLGHVDLVDEI